jgi:hypothetical protein
MIALNSCAPATITCEPPELTTAPTALAPELTFWSPENNNKKRSVNLTNPLTHCDNNSIIAFFHKSKQPFSAKKNKKKQP